MGLTSQVTGRLKAAAGALLGSESSRSKGKQEERSGEVREQERVRDERQRAEKAKADARFEERREERRDQTEAARRRAEAGH